MPAYLGVGRLQRHDQMRRRWPARTPCAMGLPVNADVPMGGRHQNRCVKPAPQSTPVWATACLAALQGGQARRTARSSKTKHQNRALTARKQRFLTAVHST